MFERSETYEIDEFLFELRLADMPREGVQRLQQLSDEDMARLNFLVDRSNDHVLENIQRRRRNTDDLQRDE